MLTEISSVYRIIDIGRRHIMKTSSTDFSDKYRVRMKYG